MKEHPLTGYFLREKMGFKTVNISDEAGIIVPVLTDEQKTTLANHIKNDADIETLRLKRNKRLASTDSWALSDRTMTDAQKKYRQDLRDLPAKTSDPSNPTWPTKPS
tara:strand:- start:100 stop:420 length:321 start_codon:yes stop_codon:yes gene_type:complete